MPSCKYIELFHVGYCYGSYIMKKIFSFAIAFAAIAAVAFVGCSKKTPPIVVVTHGEIAPFSMQDKSGEFSGFDIDLMKMIAKSMGRAIEFKKVSFEEMLDAVKTKKGDVAIGGISITEERSKEVDFSTPYHSSGFVLLLSDTTVINSLEDLGEKMIGVRAGTWQENIAKSIWEKNIRNLFVRSYTNLTLGDITSKIQSGELAAVVLDADEARYILNNNGGFKMVSLDSGTFDMGIVTMKGSVYSAEINKILNEKKDEVEQLRIKWFSAAAK